MLIKNQKTNNRKIGSETTISLNSITDELKGLRTTDDQIPKSHQGLRANPGGAIPFSRILRIPEVSTKVTDELVQRVPGGAIYINSRDFPTNSG